MNTALTSFLGCDCPPVKSLGWFGLSADPPTLAHRAIVDAALGSGFIERLVVFPAGNLSYKNFQATDWQRMEMTEIWAAAAGFDEEILLSRFDIERELAMPWIVLWKKIIQIAPKVKHYLVVGSDQYLDIAKTWDKGEELLWAANFLVIPRVGFPIEKLEYNHHHLLQVSAVPGSSTAVREGNLDGVDEKVGKYIEEEGVYQ